MQGRVNEIAELEDKLLLIESLADWKQLGRGGSSTLR